MHSDQLAQTIETRFRTTKRAAKLFRQTTSLSRNHASIVGLTKREARRGHVQIIVQRRNSVCTSPPLPCSKVCYQGVGVRGEGAVDRASRAGVQGGVAQQGQWSFQWVPGESVKCVIEFHSVYIRSLQVISNIQTTQSVWQRCTTIPQEVWYLE